MKKRIAIGLLALMLCLGLLPQAARAATTRKEVLLSPEELTTEDRLAYGTYQEKPLFWNILDPLHACDNQTPGLFLLCQSALNPKIFFNVEGNPTWPESYARNWCQTFAGLNPQTPGNFNQAEEAALLTVNKTEAAESVFELDWAENRIEDPVFFLSVQELRDYVNESILQGPWWLRSQTVGANLAGYVSGTADEIRTAGGGTWMPPRPALNLNPENIVMQRRACSICRSRPQHDDDLLLPMISAGARGVISVASNVL